jgi:hypothetical protein
MQCVPTTTDDDDDGGSRIKNNDRVAVQKSSNVAVYSDPCATFRLGSASGGLEETGNADGGQANHATAGTGRARKERFRELGNLAGSRNKRLGLGDRSWSTGDRRAGHAVELGHQIVAAKDGLHGARTDKVVQVDVERHSHGVKGCDLVQPVAEFEDWHSTHGDGDGVFLKKKKRNLNRSGRSAISAKSSNAMAKAFCGPFLSAFCSILSFFGIFFLVRFECDKLKISNAVQIALGLLLKAEIKEITQGKKPIEQPQQAASVCFTVAGMYAIVGVMSYWNVWMNGKQSQRTLQDFGTIPTNR